MSNTWNDDKLIKLICVRTTAVEGDETYTDESSVYKLTGLTFYFNILDSNTTPPANTEYNFMQVYNKYFGNDSTCKVSDDGTTENIGETTVDTEYLGDSITIGHNGTSYYLKHGTNDAVQFTYMYNNTNGYDVTTYTDSDPDSLYRIYNQPVTVDGTDTLPLYRCTITTLTDIKINAKILAWYTLNTDDSITNINDSFCEIPIDGYNINPPDGFQIRVYCMTGEHIRNEVWWREIGIKGGATNLINMYTATRTNNSGYESGLYGYNPEVVDANMSDTEKAEAIKNNIAHYSIGTCNNTIWYINADHYFYHDNESIRTQFTSIGSYARFCTERYQTSGYYGNQFGGDYMYGFTRGCYNEISGDAVSEYAMRDYVSYESNKVYADCADDDKNTGYNNTYTIPYYHEYSGYGGGWCDWIMNVFGIPASQGYIIGEENYYYDESGYQNKGKARITYGSCLYSPYLLFEHEYYDFGNYVVGDTATETIIKAPCKLPNGMTVVVASDGNPAIICANNTTNIIIKNNEDINLVTLSTTNCSSVSGVTIPVYEDDLTTMYITDDDTVSPLNVLCTSNNEYGDFNINSTDNTFITTNSNVYIESSNITFDLTPT